MQEHNDLIQSIILKNRHLKDIIGKEKYVLSRIALKGGTWDAWILKNFL